MAPRAPGQAPAALSRAWSTPLLAVILLPPTVWATHELYTTAIIELAVLQSTFEGMPPQFIRSNYPDSESEPQDRNPTRPLVRPKPLIQSSVEEAITRVEQALKHRPDDPSGHIQAAGHYLRLYRLREYARLLATSYTLTRPQAWQQSSLAVTQYYLATGNPAQREAILANPDIERHLKPAARHLQTAARHAPLDPTSHYVLGQLAAISHSPDDALGHFEHAASVAHFDPDLLFESGLIHLYAGRTQSAFNDWRRSLAVSNKHLPEVLRVLKSSSEFLQQITSVLPDDPSILVQAAADLQAAKQTRIARPLLDRAILSLEAEPRTTADSISILAQAYLLQDRVIYAIDAYTRLLAATPNDAEARYNLARALRRARRLHEAQQQAYLAREIVPDNHEYEKLLDDITQELTQRDANTDKLRLLNQRSNF